MLARWNDIKMLQALIYFGAEIDLRTKGRETALHIAASFSRKEAAMYLLSKDADRTCKNYEENKTAEQLCVDPEIRHMIGNWNEYKKMRKL